MAPSVSYCIVCNDDDEDVVYKCKGNGGACTYQLCAGCVKASFNDMSGADSSFCALCKHPSTLDMISAVLGRGAINAVEEKLRNEIEFQVKKEQLMKRDASRCFFFPRYWYKTNATDMNEQARKIFNQLSERLNLKCPRCKTVFHDYDGCNALNCALPTCRAAFCAVCLKDCGSDAHAHVREAHGGYFDKAAFKESTARRANIEIDKLMASLSNESFKLQQLVRNQIDKAQLLSKGRAADSSATIEGGGGVACHPAAFALFSMAIAIGIFILLYFFVQRCDNWFGERVGPYALIERKGDILSSTATPPTRNKNQLGKLLNYVVNPLAKVINYIVQFVISTPLAKAIRRAWAYHSANQCPREEDYLELFPNSNPLAKVINQIVQFVISTPLAKAIRRAWAYHSADQSPREEDYLEQFSSRLMEWLGGGLRSLALFFLLLVYGIVMSFSKMIISVL